MRYLVTSFVIYVCLLVWRLILHFSSTSYLKYDFSLREFALALAGFFISRRVIKKKWKWEKNRKRESTLSEMAIYQNHQVKYAGVRGNSFSFLRERKLYIYLIGRVIKKIHHCNATNWEKRLLNRLFRKQFICYLLPIRIECILVDAQVTIREPPRFYFHICFPIVACGVRCAFGKIIPAL